MKTLQLELYKIIDIIDSGIVPDEQVIEILLEAVYDQVGSDSLLIFTKLIEQEKKDLKEKNLQAYKAIEAGVHGMAAWGKETHERNMGSYELYDTMFDHNNANLTWIIELLKTYFPEAKPDGASNYGRWFFEKGQNIIIAQKEDLLNGKQLTWAKRNGHYNYIKKIIENYDEE